MYWFGIPENAGDLALTGTPAIDRWPPVINTALIQQKLDI